MKKTKRSPAAKLKGEALAAYEALQARVASHPGSVASQLRLLDLGIGEFATRLPAVVLSMLDAAQPISVDDAKLKAGASKTSWQDFKATLELQLRLVRARAHWEDGDPQRAAEQFKQISASASSRRAELILEAAALCEGWTPAFSLALLRSASGALSNSLEAALSLIDALTGSGEHQAAALVLSQLIAGWAAFPTLDRGQLVTRVERLPVESRAGLNRDLDLIKDRA
ncbi:MAG: hypothetical protein Q8N23_20040 [Archangium sp.]|nr:hypothetical protein [Archangium sp.]MDP3154980.1 hypothetical protein [Archangium sp.]MDP3573084.1 hypothetical protein [Archangium sp.]